MKADSIDRGEPLGAVFNFLTGLVLLAILAFISGCLIERGAQSYSLSSSSDHDAPSSRTDTRSGHIIPGDLKGMEMNDLEVMRRHEAIELSARYLVRTCGEDGQFEYKINLDPSIRIEPRYNMLRHCGAMYSLGMYCEQVEDAEALAALGRAAEFLQTRAIDELAEDDSLLAVWSHPDINQVNAPPQAKLGGSGLGLVALTSAKRLIPGSVPIRTIQGLGNFILFMQKPDGSFYSKYIPEKGGRQDAWTSLYYPGEAALGLLMLYEINPDPRWLSGALDALTYLARSREGADVVPADHWALLATARLFSICDDYGIDIDDERDRLIDHAVQVCRSMMGEQVLDVDSPRLMGGFASDGRTTPTSTRLEGLLAALTFMPSAHDEDRRMMEETIQRGMIFLQNAQIRSGPYAGAVPRAVMPLDEIDSPKAIEFNRRVREVRIDYVQHAMCAMMQYVQAFAPRSAQAEPID